jgi:hypothetical protein
MFNVQIIKEALLLIVGCTNICFPFFSPIRGIYNSRAGERIKQFVIEENYAKIL